MNSLIRFVAIVVAIVVVVDCAPPKPESFAGHKVLSVVPKSAEELRILKELEHDERLDLDFWAEPIAVGKEVGIRVSPGEQENAVRERLADMKVVDSVEDLQQLINYQDLSNFAASLRGSSVVGRYARVDEIYSWLDDLVRDHPGLVSPFNGGKSYKGRQLKGIKVGHSAPGKPALWLHAGIHAREWVSIASVNYIIEQLLTSSQMQHLRDNIVWYILPVVNPDGYEYTFTNNRMWRKTVQPHTFYCIGADPNRNWGTAFGTTGISRNPCSDIYPGPHAFSEPETRTLSQTIMSLKNELKGFISFHSFSQLWMMPWGYTKSTTNDYDELMRVARAATQKVMNVYGTSWRVGPPSHILYEASGGSFDWVKDKVGIKYAYTLECRPASMNPGFMLPASGIIPSGRETWAGVQYVAEYLIQKYGNRG